jgi:arginase
VAGLTASGHDVVSSTVKAVDDDSPGEIRTTFEIQRTLAGRVRGAVGAGRFPLVVAGNCNVATGVLAGLAPAIPAVLWFDAHADCNTPETTSSGFLDGMALATAMGWCWRSLTASVDGFQPVPASRVLLLGTRDVDPAEARRMAEADVRAEPPDALRRGALTRHLNALGTSLTEAYVHVDLDVLDPTEGHANPFAVTGGLTLAECEDALGTIKRRLRIAGAAITAYAPEYDPAGRIAEAAVRIAVALAGAP